MRVLQGYSSSPFTAVGSGATVDSEVAAEREAALDALMRPWREKYPETVLTATARQGRAQSLLLQASSEAGLLVLGRRDRLRSGPYTGPVVQAAVHHARCPTAVVPHA
ncbi:universal stress protein [Streptomyces sp. NPDC045714]|uniref:universal stress protein n=1 Tax=Streptomyces sp. NPDC045714 TaxID=3154913 RepID=UPI0033D638DC